MSSDDSKEVKKDYLEVDDAIPGQQYVCLSFVSPETLVKKKEAFDVCKFLQSYCKEQKLKYDEIYSKYEDFCYKFKDELQRDFDEQNNFQTSIRGVKVRGVYSTKDEAEARAKKLSTLDSSFHVFVGQVGYWLPWDPNADGVENEVFQNTQLNEMMEKYQENNINRDIFYEEQKRDKIAAAKEEAEKKRREQLEEERKKQNELEDKTYDLDTTEPIKEEIVEESVGESVEESVDGSVDKSIELEEPETEEIETNIDSSLKSSLENADPWLAKKLQDSEKVVEDVKEVVEDSEKVVEDVKEVVEDSVKVTKED